MTAVDGCTGQLSGVATPTPRFGTGISIPFGVCCMFYLLLKWLTPQNVYACSVTARLSRGNISSLSGYWKTGMGRGPFALSFDNREPIKLGSPERTAKVVCSECNQGWMSDLEKAAQPILSPMMFDISVPLGLLQQYTIVKWAVKTAMVHDGAARHRRLIYAREMCSSLRSRSARRSGRGTERLLGFGLPPTAPLFGLRPRRFSCRAISLSIDCSTGGVLESAAGRGEHLLGTPNLRS